MCDLGVWRVRVVSTKLEYTTSLGQVLPWGATWAPLGMDTCKENGPLAHLLWILVFDVQHNQIGLMNLQVFVCSPIGCKT